MTWTYDGAPGTSTAAERRDAVRLLVGDTDSTDELASDEAITFSLSEAGDGVYGAAAIIARSIAGLFARQTDSSFESIRISASQKAGQYHELASRLERQAKTRGAGLGAPVAGGVSIDEIDSANDDSDRPQPRFRRGAFGNPPSDDRDQNWEDWR